MVLLRKSKYFGLVLNPWLTPVNFCLTLFLLSHTLVASEIDKSQFKRNSDVNENRKSDEKLRPNLNENLNKNLTDNLTEHLTENRDDGQNKNSGKHKKEPINGQQLETMTPPMPLTPQSDLGRRNDSTQIQEGDKVRLRKNSKFKEKSAEAKRGRQRPDSGNGNLDREDSLLTFPDWVTSEFDYFFNPIVGFASQKFDYPTFSRLITVGELGGTFGLSGIPLVANNPGLGMGASVGSAFGSYQMAEGTKLEWKGSGSAYQRNFGDGTMTWYGGFFRNQIRIAKASMVYKAPDWKASNIQSASIENDAGWRLNENLSAHYRLSLDKAWTESISQSQLTGWDHWFYGQFRFHPLGLLSNFGPGVSFIRQRDFKSILTQSDILNTSRLGQESSFKMTYVKVVLQMNPIWKLIGVSSTKWNLLSQSTGPQTAFPRLPQESIYNVKELGLSSDSLSSSNFIGLANLLGGLSVGYQTNLTITNLSDPAQKQTTRTSGLALNYSLAI